jgi:hypothetical protein
MPPEGGLPAGAGRREHRAEIAAAMPGVLVRAGRTTRPTSPLRAAGSVPDTTFWWCSTSFRVQPGRLVPRPGDADTPLAPNERVWSNPMDPAAAAELLSDGGRQPGVGGAGDAQPVSVPPPSTRFP